MEKTFEEHYPYSNWKRDKTRWRALIKGIKEGKVTPSMLLEEEGILTQAEYEKWIMKEVKIK